MGMSNVNRSMAIRWLQQQQGQNSNDVKNNLDNNVNAPGFEELPEFVEKQVLDENINAPCWHEHQGYNPNNINAPNFDQFNNRFER